MVNKHVFCLKEKKEEKSAELITEYEWSIEDKQLYKYHIII